MEKEYPVVTLCGSTKFKDAFVRMQKELTLKGYIVIAPSLFGHSDDKEIFENMDNTSFIKTKNMLAEMCKSKIDMSDEIFIINVDGYIGDSTKIEIEYAISKNKKVNYLESIKK